MKQPIEFFERKAILANLRKKETRVYPKTKEPIRLSQLKENITIRNRIEDEMRKLNLPL